MRFLVRRMMRSSSLWKFITISTANYLVYRLLTVTVFRAPSQQNVYVQLPSDPETLGGQGIPKKIWQTWHTPTIGLAEEVGDRVRTWQENNPVYRYELLTDHSGDSYVLQHFSNDDLIRDTFLNLSDPILRADFLSYLVLYADGGIYSDIDVSCLAPFDTWASPEHLSQAGAIVGVEKDRDPIESDYRVYQDYRSYIFDLNKWTFASKPRHPFMRGLIETVTRNLLALSQKQKRPLWDLQPNYKEIFETTGPRAFSEAFWAYVSQVEGRRISYKSAMGLEQPKMFGDVLMLPIRAMSFTEAESGKGAKSPKIKPVVMHWTVGTWKPTHSPNMEQQPLSAEMPSTPVGGELPPPVQPIAAQKPEGAEIPAPPAPILPEQPGGVQLPPPNSPIPPTVEQRPEGAEFPLPMPPIPPIPDAVWMPPPVPPIDEQKPDVGNIPPHYPLNVEPGPAGVEGPPLVVAPGPAAEFPGPIVEQRPEGGGGVQVPIVG